MAIRQVFWDWNGTLLDDLAYAVDVRNRVFPRFGLPAIDSLERYYEQFTFPVRLYYERAGVTDANFAAVANAWMDEYVRGFDSLSLREGALEALKRLHARGIRQVVLSASKRELLGDQLSRFPIVHYFDTYLGLGDIYAGSKEEIGLTYLRSCSISPQESLMIGDTLHDAEVARAMGVACVLVSGGHQSRETLLSTGLTVVDSLMEAAQAAG